jgi:type II restriction enzyme
MFLRDSALNARGWLLAVMRAVEAVGRPEFTLDDVYAHEAALSALYPDNRNVRPKIRQQLQMLRDRGWLEFTARRGTYRLTGPLSRWERA